MRLMHSQVRKGTSMRNARINAAGVCIYLCCIMVSIAAADGENMRWEEVSNGIRERDLDRVAVVRDDPDTVFISSQKAVYKTVNNGEEWNEILSFRGTGNAVNTIFAISGKPLTVYAGTKEGLFRSDDGGTGWKRIFSGMGEERSAVFSIAISPEAPERIIIGTGAGIFVSSNNGSSWVKGQNIPSDRTITFVAIDRSNPYRMYAAADQGVFRSLNGGSGWKKVLDRMTADDDDQFSDGEEGEDDGEAEQEGAIRGIALDESRPGMLYAATSEGLRISRDSGETWQRAGTLGLGSRDIRHILLDTDMKPRIYAATGRGVFRFTPASDVWEELYIGMVSPEIRYLALSRDINTERKTLWAATQKGIYRATVPVHNSENSLRESGTDPEQEMLSVFAHEPTIMEVREAAIEYAEVQPDKISKWRRAAAGRAWLPDIKVEYAKGKDWQSSTYFYSTSSQKYTDDDITKGKDRSWSVSANWELGDLIWNSAQTSIDTRSRLVVQLRDDVLAEVTRLYFERRRLIVKMLLSPPETVTDKIENELRLQELTAGLDALTGSYFSRKLDQGKRQ